MQNDFGVTVNTEQELIDKVLKKAKTANGISVALYQDELYFVLHKNGKPLGKISVEWCFSAYDNFIEDIGLTSEQRH